MDQDRGTDNARLAMETKESKLQTLPAQELITDDIIGLSTLGTTKHATASPCVSQEETISPVSSSDTFVTACEEPDSKEDCSSIAASSLPFERVSPVTIFSKPTLASKSDIPIPDTEDDTKGFKQAVVDSFDSLSLVSVGDHDNNVKSATLPEPLLGIDLAASAIAKPPRSQLSQGTAVAFDKTQKQDQSFINSANPDVSRIVPPPSSVRSMASSKKKNKKLKARREGQNLTIMTPINEEEGPQCATTNDQAAKRVKTKDQPSHPAELDVSSTASQSQAAASTKAQSRVKPLSAKPTVTQPTTTNTFSAQAADLITRRIVNTHQHVSFFDRPSRPGQLSANLLSSPLLFSYDQPHKITNCWLPTCDRPTISSDARTVICPRCTDRSYVRYCSTSHLITDMRDHYKTNCGRRQNLVHIEESTMTPIRGAIREFVRVAVEDHDSIERHRQALYHAYPPESDTTTISTRPPSDYYIFSDADRFDATGLPVTVANLNEYRGTGSIAGRVRYPQDEPRKALFAVLLERLLVLGVSAGSTNKGWCKMLFLWIKENLVAQGEWTEIMITRICLAMQLEFGWNVDKELRN